MKNFFRLAIACFLFGAGYPLRADNSLDSDEEAEWGLSHMSSFKAGSAVDVKWVDADAVYRGECETKKGSETYFAVVIKPFLEKKDLYLLIEEARFGPADTHARAKGRIQAAFADYSPLRNNSWGSAASYDEYVTVFGTLRDRTRAHKYGLRSYLGDLYGSYEVVKFASVHAWTESEIFCKFDLKNELKP